MSELINHTLGKTMIEKEQAAVARTVFRKTIIDRFMLTPAGRMDSVGVWWLCALAASCVSLFAMVSSVRLALLW